MADIAILVAEEYERRMKASRNIGQGAEPTTATVAVGGGVAVEKLKREAGNWVRKEEEGAYVEPRSQMGGAAFSGFFSA